ncbi:MAG: PEP-utilizing enzyme, partial [Lachnospiraceae bacterium]
TMCYVLGTHKEPGTHVKQNSRDTRVVIANGYHQLRSVSYMDKRVPVLSDEQIHKLCKMAAEVRMLLKMEVDVEFSLVEGCIYILQARAITSNQFQNKQVKEKMKKADRKIRGQQVSSGYFKGRVCKVESDSIDIINLKMNNNKIILLVNELSPQFIYNMKNIGAIITAKGGTLSHGAIVAREQEIPCITGIGEKIDDIKDGDLASVNADSGEVILYG